MSHNLNLFLLLFLFYWEAGAQLFDFSEAQYVNNSVGGSHLSFDRNNQFDFNLDGVNDRVECSNSHYVKIIDGKNGGIIQSWSGPNLPQRAFSGCEVMEISGSRYPMLIITQYRAQHWVDPAHQYVMFHNGRQYIVKRILLRNVNNQFYAAAVRSSSCTKMPARVRQLSGEKDGIWCFFAAYPWANYNKSALLKIEYNNGGDNLKIYDISGGSDLPWAGAAIGTPAHMFPVGYGFNSAQRDGLFMMDSAFADFDDDGLEDLITVGQHSSIRSHRLIVDSSRPHFFRFVTNRLTTANRYTEMTEFLKVSHIGEIDQSINTPCLYFSGEFVNIKHQDHIRCFNYDKAGWSTFYLPTTSSSEIFNASAKLNNQGKMIIKTRKKEASGAFSFRTLLVD